MELTIAQAKAISMKKYTLIMEAKKHSATAMGFDVEAEDRSDLLTKIKALNPEIIEDDWYELEETDPSFISRYDNHNTHWWCIAVDLAETARCEESELRRINIGFSIPILNHHDKTCEIELWNPEEYDGVFSEKVLSLQANSHINYEALKILDNLREDQNLLPLSMMINHATETLSTLLADIAWWIADKEHEIENRYTETVWDPTANIGSNCPEMVSRWYYSRKDFGYVLPAKYDDYTDNCGNTFKQNKDGIRIIECYSPVRYCGDSVNQNFGSELRGGLLKI